jgi:hypothetical protein
LQEEIERDRKRCRGKKGQEGERERENRECGERDTER